MNAGIGGDNTGLFCAMLHTQPTTTTPPAMTTVCVTTCKLFMHTGTRPRTTQRIQFDSVSWYDTVGRDKPCRGTARSSLARCGIGIAGCSTARKSCAWQDREGQGGKGQVMAWHSMAREGWAHQVGVDDVKCGLLRLGTPLRYKQGECV